MRTLLLTWLWAGLALAAFAQADSLAPRLVDDETEAKALLRTRALNAFYNEVYRLDADLSWVTPPFFEQFGPRNYLLTADVVPNFFLLASKRYRASVVITPRVKVRIMTGES